jgi:DNA-directed RNA polymerase subunit RPC12/RpoP
MERAPVSSAAPAAIQCAANFNPVPTAGPLVQSKRITVRCAGCQKEMERYKEGESIDDRDVLYAYEMYRCKACGTRVEVRL